MINRAVILVKKTKPAKNIKILPVNRIIESRMALKLDDLIGKKKEVAQILDLSKATANNHDEFKKLMEKVPEFRIKAEKVKPEDVKTYEKETRGRKKSKKRSDEANYQFSDPVPEEMKSVKLSDLCPVNIQWNMLTTLRPKSKLDTEYFSRSKPHKGKTSVLNSECLTRRLFNERRLVELGKLVLATQEKEKKITNESFKRKMKNRSGVVETRYLSCAECGEDFCQKENCTLFAYENFKREPEKEVLAKKDDQKRGRPLTKGKKSRSKSKKKGAGSKSADRNKSKNRSASKTKTASKNIQNSFQKKATSPTKKRSPSKTKGGKKKSKSPTKPKKTVNKK